MLSMTIKRDRGKGCRMDESSVSVVCEICEGSADCG